MGRIIYERSGEFFFIPYAFTDVNDERDIHKGDEVSFYMAKNKRWLRVGVCVCVRGRGQWCMM